MKNIVLLTINAKYIHSSLSVWYIAEGISRYSRFSYNVSVVEATKNQKCDVILSMVEKHNPDVIGISTYIWNAGILPDLLQLLKSNLPDAIIVMGGPEASNNADFWLENNADHVLGGEGEYVFPKFLDSLFNENEHDKNENTENQNDIIDPYSETYLNALNGRLSYIETSRGCPFKCSFCLSAKSDVKYFPLVSVKAQIFKLSQADTRTVKFVDRTFNCNKKRAFEIFEYVIGLNTACTFHFEVAADLFDEKTLLLLGSAPPGRIQFEIGIQSFFTPALDAVSRKTDIDKAEQNIKTLLGYQNIHIHIDLIAGLPYETLSEFINSFNRAYLIYAHNLQLGFLKVLHGSVLKEQADKYNLVYSNDSPYEIIKSPWLSTEDIVVLKSVENSLQHTYNKGRFLSALNYLLMTTSKNPFNLFLFLGKNVPNHGIQLENYITLLYEKCKTLPGVDADDLADCLIYDWLTMVKGKNTPAFLKNDSPNRKLLANTAEIKLNRKLKREEYAVLRSGAGIFVDCNDCDPVTGLYKVYVCR